MSKPADAAWRLAAIVAIDLLSPLPLLSLALFMSLAYIATLLAPVRIDFWAAILCLSVLLPLLALSGREAFRWRRKRRYAKPLSLRACLPLLPLLIFLPVFTVALSQPSTDGIWHMDIYLVYSQQIFLRVSPPENIFLPGHAATHYWLFHALSAAFTRLTRLDLYSAYNLLNAVFFFAGLYWVGRSLIALKLAESRTLKLGFAILFVYGAVNLSACLVFLANLAMGAEAVGVRALSMIEGTDVRVFSAYAKMIHASGMTPAVMAFTAALYACIRILKGETDRLTLAILSAGAIVALGAMPIVAPFLAFPLLGGMLLAAWAAHGRAAIFRRLRGGVDRFSLALWLLLSCVLALPLVKYGLDMSEGARQGSSFIQVEGYNFRQTLKTQLLLIPFFAAHAALALRSRRIENVFVLAAGLLGFFLALGFVLPQNNQYKFHFPLSMILALSALFALRQLARSRTDPWRRLASVLMFALFALAFANALLSNYAVVERVLRKAGDASYSGIQVEPTSEKGWRRAAYAWLRDHAPIEAVVLAPHSSTRVASLFHERLNYVRIGMSNHVANNPAFDKRIVELHQFYDSSIPMDDYAVLLQSMRDQLPSRPFYAVVNDSEVSRDLMQERGAEMVYENPSAGAHVYLLNPSP